MVQEGKASRRRHEGHQQRTTLGLGPAARGNPFVSLGEALRTGKPGAQAGPESKPTPAYRAQPVDTPHVATTSLGGWGR